MRIVIDKDISEIQTLNEAYENSKPKYKVLVIENGEKFVYGKSLKIDEAVDAIYDAAFDPMFGKIEQELVEVFEGSERTIWSSDNKVKVFESALVPEADGNNKEGDTSNKDAKTGQNKPGFLRKLGGAIGNALKGLKKGMDIVGAMTKQFSKDALKKWREAGYFNKQGRITGLGYKVMTGQVKNTIPVDTDPEEAKKNDITQAWKVAQSNVINACKQNGMTVNGEVKAIVKSDRDPITLSVDVTDKDGNNSTIEMNQDGTTVDGDAQNAQNGGAGAGVGAGAGSTALAGASPEKIAAAVDKNPT